MPRLLGTHALLALLVAWALAIALHLLRERRRRVLVPFMPLWDALLLPESTTRLFGRLRRIGSIAIALAISGLLILALNDAERASGRTRHSTLLLIDRGQSMQSRDRAEPSRRAALQLMAAKPADDTLLVAQLDAVVTPLSTFSSDRHVLQRALDELTETDAATDFAAGVGFARRVLNGRPNPKLILISDAAFDRDPKTLGALASSKIAFEQLPVGASRRNLGIRAFSARRYRWNRDQSELLLTLENAGDQTEPIELTLRSDDVPIAVTRLELAPHSVVSRSYTDLPATAERLEARIEARGPAGPDPLPSDDRAFATLPAAKRLRILLVSNGDRYLEAALLLDRSHDVHTQAPSAYRSALGYDVVVFDACVPDAPPEAPALYLAPPANRRDFPFAVRGEIARPYFDDFALDQALLRDLALRDVNIGRALRLVLQPGDRAIASFHKTPLIVIGERAQRPFVALSFDLRDSDLPLRVAWPLFVRHVLDRLVPFDSDYRPSLAVGVEQRIPLARPAAHARIIDPSGRAFELEPREGALVFRPERAGFYRIETPSEQQLLAANRPAKSLSITPHVLTPARAPARSEWTRPSELWQLALLLVWLITSLEWFAYQRRWTA